MPDPLRILIVDDDFNGASSLARLLTLRITIEQRPLEVTMVQTMEEGLKYAALANVTILDLDLPDSTPSQTLDAIRLFRPPVIIMTGHDDAILRAQAKINGAEAFMVKGQIIGLCGIVIEAILKDILLKSGLVTS